MFGAEQFPEARGSSVVALGFGRGEVRLGEVELVPDTAFLVAAEQFLAFGECALPERL